MKSSSKINMGAKNKVPIKTVSLSAFKVQGERAYSRAIETIVQWMSERSHLVPTDAYTGIPFQVGTGTEYFIEAVSIEYDGVSMWSSRLEDRREEGVFERTWVTEITVGSQGSNIAVGIRLYIVGRGGSAGYVPSRPGCIPKLINSLYCISDDEPLSADVIDINEYNVDKFKAILTSKTREIPIIVGSKNPKGRSCVDLNKLSGYLSGLCNVYIVNDAAARDLTDSYGKANSVFWGAVKIYRPRFDPIDGNPFDHPLWIMYAGGKNEQTKRFEEIVNEVCELSLVESNYEYLIPRYDEVRSYVARVNIQKETNDGRNTVELLKLYEIENDELRDSIKQQKNEYDLQISNYQENTRVLSALRDQLISEKIALNSRIKSLEVELGRAPSVRTALKRFSDIDVWVRENLIGSIWVSDKAIRECEKNGVFRNIEFFSRVLLFFRDVIVPMRRKSNSELYLKYKRTLSEWGLVDTSCFSNKNDIKNFPEYRVTYNGLAYYCDEHIKFGGGTDHRSMFRIYYHWHAEEGIALIGHMPTHLDNNMTD